ncbi:N-acetyltransferase [Sulfuriflexus sp.]|uniref:GNAT family N-acetyltransferase n=1 Tax=Sulfuriflexus sp. TaxID=2015443 RepID=UPI0028CC164C|nr:N-acetyltransferase [Sulfuriflexus sp.]MDT8405531.1 N-acetyltransferase [Sulfuriflexus sp.]
MSGILVRTERPEDYQAIDVVNLSAFEGDDEAKLIATLREQSGYRADYSLVAEFNGRPVGHLLMTPGRCNQQKANTPVMIIAPMSIVPSQSRRGIGTALVEAARKKAREEGMAAMIAVGEPGYYERLGFEPASKWGVRCNLPVPEDAVMLVELEDGTLSGGCTVNYSAPFLSLF